MNDFWGDPNCSSCTLAFIGLSCNSRRHGSVFQPQWQTGAYLSPHEKSVIILKMKERKVLAMVGRYRNICALLMGMKNGTGAIESSTKLNIGWPYDPAVPLLGHEIYVYIYTHPRELKTWPYKTLSTDVHSIIYKSQKVETTHYLPMDKQNVAYPDNGILFDHKK